MKKKECAKNLTFDTPSFYFDLHEFLTPHSQLLTPNFLLPKCIP